MTSGTSISTRAGNNAEHEIPRDPNWGVYSMEPQGRRRDVVGYGRHRGPIDRRCFRTVPS
jgi:hypothetical protein